jgi:hypothetical protein
MTERSRNNRSFSRRKLFGAAGAAVSGAALPRALAQSPVASNTGPPSPVEWLPGRVERSGDTNAITGAPSGAQHHLTSFINSEAGLTAAKFNRRRGWAIQIKPTGYRGIPIYTIKSLELKVDGVAVDPSAIVFVYNNAPYRLNQLRDLLGMQWWVFDWATLFVPGEMRAGEHDIEVSMTYANTYVLGDASMSERLRLKYHGDEVAFLCL